jgi:hypothetical protein
MHLQAEYHRELEAIKACPEQRGAVTEIEPQGRLRTVSQASRVMNVHDNRAA